MSAEPTVPEEQREEVDDEESDVYDSEGEEEHNGYAAQKGEEDEDEDEEEGELGASDNHPSLTALLVGKNGPSITEDVEDDDDGEYAEEDDDEFPTSAVPINGHSDENSDDDDDDEYAEEDEDLSTAPAGSLKKRYADEINEESEEKDGGVAKKART